MHPKMHLLVRRTHESGQASRLQTLKNPVRDWVSKDGAKETRTPDPLHAMQVLYQLSYGPMIVGIALRLGLRRVEVYTGDGSYLAKP